MSYRQTVEASHRTTFANNIQMVAQEMHGKIRSAVTIVSGLSGDAHNVRDLLDQKEYEEVEDYNMQNPQNRSNLDAVWMNRPKLIRSGEAIFKEDKFDLAMDPTSQFNASHVRACEKGVFDRFMGIRKKSGGTGYEIHGGGILGKRITGKARTPTSLPSGQVQAVDAGSSGTPAGLNLKKMNMAREQLELDDFGIDEDLSSELFCAITPKQKTNLLDIAIQTQTSLNAFQIQQIEAGKPTTLFGMTWIFTNRLPVNASGHRLCPIWTKSNIAGGFWQDIEGDIFNNGAAMNRPQVLVTCYPEATRIENEGVVVFTCLES